MRYCKAGEQITPVLAHVIVPADAFTPEPSLEIVPVQSQPESDCTDVAISDKIELACEEPTPPGTSVKLPVIATIWF